MTKQQLTFLDLFAGAGGLSEGFIRAGFRPIAHVEMDEAACYTLKTRLAYHWLQEQGRTYLYYDYVRGFLSRDELYEQIPHSILNSVLNCTISPQTIRPLFKSIDGILGNRPLDLLVGGPPCQAYSLVGRARDAEGMRFDSRNYLYRMYGRFLEHYKPDYFVFENVVGLLSAKNENGTLYLDVMKRLFRQKGYATEHRILCASDYGVPQDRKRVILVGKRLSKGERAGRGFFPEIEAPNLSPCTINELFADLPFLRAGEGDMRKASLCKNCAPFLRQAKIRTEDETETSLHAARANTDVDLAIYRIAVERWNKSGQRLSYDQLPKELINHNNTTSFLDRFKVVDGSAEASHTVVAHIHKDGHYYIHPDIAQNRSITPREAARLQTFPDSYFFESVSGVPRATPAYKQIGNAVPVLLAESIAHGMKRLYE